MAKFFKKINILLYCIFLTTALPAQKVLPDFSVKELTKGKIQISWNNPYSNCMQLAIQRSSDSSKDFRTIFSSLSPELPANGYVDAKYFPYKKRYYRIFYVLSDGAYYFSPSLSVETTTSPNNNILVFKKNDSGFLEYLKNLELENGARLIKIFVNNKEAFRITKSEYLSFRDSINHKTKDGLHKINDLAIEWRLTKLKNEAAKLTIISKKELVIAKLKKSDFQKFKDSIETQTKDTLISLDPWRKQLHPFRPVKLWSFNIYKMDTLLTKVDLDNYIKFRDSIKINTKDSLLYIDSNRFEIHGYIPKYVWRPSAFIFANNKGNVSIQLPLSKLFRYRIVFFDDEGLEIFQIKLVKESSLIVDKTNFMHAGWFTFELYENDKLKEKDKFFISKD